jgi:hypothetical protein
MEPADGRARVMTAIVAGSTTRGRSWPNTARRVNAEISMNGVSWWLEAIAAIAGIRQAARVLAVLAVICSCAALIELTREVGRT